MLRPDIIRLYKSVHTWTGIIAGLALFIAFYAGALTVFQEPIARWAGAPQDRLASVSLQQVPQLLEKIRQQEKAAVKEGITLQLHENSRTQARLHWHEHANAAHDAPEIHKGAWLDAQGQLHVQTLPHSELAEFIDFIHQRAGLPESFAAGEWLMGGIALLYALALVSGVIILLPTLIADFFALRLGKNIKRFWLDAHNVTGIISLPFHIVMVLTAVVFLLHDPIYELQDKFIHDGQLQTAWSSKAPRPEPGATLPALLPPAELLQKIQAQAPGFVVRELTYRKLGQADASVWVGGYDPRYMNRGAQGGFVSVSPYDGSLLSTDVLPGHASPGHSLIATFFSLHFASFGGNTVRCAYFLLGLAGAFLFYSGNLLWIESRRRTARKNDAANVVQSRSSYIMAALSVGVALGCISGLSLSIASGKWLHGHVLDLNAWHRGIYYFIFLGNVTWALWRGAARAASELLYVAAACTALIPLASLLALLLPGNGLWTHSPVLAVDMTALLGAVTLLLVAGASKHRTRQGSRDSVWAHPVNRHEHKA